MMRWTTTRASARSLVIWPKNFPSASAPSGMNRLCWMSFFREAGDCQMALAQADELEADRILFSVGFLSNDPEDLCGVRPHRCAARRGYLLRQLDHLFGGGG